MRYDIQAPQGAAFSATVCGIVFENGAATIEAEPSAWEIQALRQLGYTITDSPVVRAPAATIKGDVSHGLHATDDGHEGNARGDRSNRDRRRG